MLIDEPIFCISGDVDWASEHCIQDFVSTVAAFDMRPTLFSTHDSRAMRLARDAKTIDVGWHPNFLPGSSHGATEDDVFRFFEDLEPDAVCFRSHWFFEHSGIVRRMVDRGMQFDSNLCLYLQTDLVPLRHGFGHWRYPVFWEDDIHFDQGTTWDFSAYEDRFFTPGLKIINVHPFIFALNTPDPEFYAANKSNIPSLSKEEQDALMFKGDGSRSFFVAMLEAVRRRGARVVSLAELHELNMSVGVAGQ